MRIWRLHRMPKAELAEVARLMTEGKAEARSSLEAASPARPNDIWIMEGSSPLDDVAERARIRRSFALGVLRGFARSLLVLAGLLVLGLPSAALLIAVDIHVAWKAVGIAAYAVFLTLAAAGARRAGRGLAVWIDDLRWNGRAWTRDKKTIRQIAGSAWRLGGAGIHARDVPLDDREAELSVTFVPYEAISSVILLEGWNIVAFTDGRPGGRGHVLKDVSLGLGPYELAHLIIRGARSAGHEIPHMAILSLGLRKDGVAVPEGAVERLASTLSAGTVREGDATRVGRLVVDMTRADEIPLSERVASFEGCQVEYDVPRGRMVDQAGDHPKREETHLT